MHVAAKLQSGWNQQAVALHHLLLHFSIGDPNEDEDGTIKLWHSTTYCFSFPSAIRMKSVASNFAVRTGRSSCGTPPPTAWRPPLTIAWSACGAWDTSRYMC
eukprot:582866-Pelagomonas_calceolata.AAC.2